MRIRIHCPAIEDNMIIIAGVLLAGERVHDTSGVISSSSSSLTYSAISLSPPNLLL